MDLPFTAEQFFDVFARYNAGLWPAPVALNGMALLAVALIFARRPSQGRWIAAILSVFAAWVAVAYHFAYFAAINPAAWGFGGAFLVGAIWMAWVGIVRGRLRFRPKSGVAGWTGGALIAFSLLVYPALGRLFGHEYPAAPTFGVPCPTTIFTVGMLLFAQAPVPRSLFVLPILWAAVGSTAAVTLGVYQDFGLLVAGIVALAALLWPRLLAGRASAAGVQPA